MAVIRIFFGVILSGNGPAKVDADLRGINFEAFHANLVTREERGILNIEVNNRQVTKTSPKGNHGPYLQRFVNNVVLKQRDVFQWVVALTQLGTGGMFFLGLAMQGTVLLALGQQLLLAAVYFSSHRPMFEQPHDEPPLVALILMPADLVWGLER